MKTNLVILFCLLSSQLIAQHPKTAIYLFNIEREGKSLTLNTPKLISKRTGYNNQPYFSPYDDYLFYVSSMDTSNIEIMKVNLLSKKLKPSRITRTKEAEYSPKLSSDPLLLSCVRVEADDSTQHLALYNLKGKAKGVVLSELKNIGYYEWVTQNEFISFELPEPFYLVLHSIQSKRADTIATNIGRTFYYQANKSRLIYVDKSDTAKWFIKILDQEKLRKIRRGQQTESITLSETLRGEEDYCFMQDGSLLMGQQGILYIKKNPFKNPTSRWEKWVDLKQFGISKFYRIAINRDNTKLAVVGFEGLKP